MQKIPMALAGMEPLVTVGVVLLLLFGVLSWLTRRMQGGGRFGGVDPARRSIRLTPEHAVHVVELGGQRLVIGTGPGGPPRLIAQLGRPGQSEPAPADASTPAHASVVAPIGSPSDG